MPDTQALAYRGRFLLHLLIPGVIVFFSLRANAQAGELTISAVFRDQPLVQILRQLEDGYPLRFFYRPTDLPTGTMSQAFSETPLADALNRLLEGTPLDFLIYRDEAIVIGPAAMLAEMQTPDYYQALAQSLTVESTPPGRGIVTIGAVGSLTPSGEANVTGKVIDRINEEPIIGATLLWSDLGRGVSTDQQGQFAIDLPIGQHTLLVQYVGYENLNLTNRIMGSGELNIELSRAAINLREVIVEADAPDANIGNPQIGVTRLNLQSIQRTPAFLGEVDVIRSLLQKPGVSTIGEGAIGFNVRGGEADQNLLLLDEGVLFNPSHALGFFSTFNSDLLSRVTLYKGHIPAQYGGRLASVLDVEMRDGDFRQFHIKGGVGPVSARVSLDGPLVRDKSAFLIGFRSSYSDWILRRIRVPELRRSSAFFYDANLRFTQKVGKGNNLTLGAYASRDEFTYNEQFGFTYETLMGQVIYRHLFSNRLFARFSGTAGSYRSARLDLEGSDAARLENGLAYGKLSAHLTWSPRKSTQWDAGLSSTFYLVDPGRKTPSGPLSLVSPSTVDKERGLETALFLNMEWSPLPAWSFSGGVRLVVYQFLGPGAVLQYEDATPPDITQVRDTLRYGAGKVIASYFSPEPRLSARFRLNAVSALKAGYSRTAQFINQLFNTDSPTPASLFQLSTTYLPPFRAHHFSLGYFRNFQDNQWETSVEGYARAIDQLYDYRDFADLAVNPHIETEILQGTGRAYGLEMSIIKKKGLVNGALSYTLSRTERKVEGINQGRWYPSNFDQPHNLSLNLNYNYNQRHTIALHFNYIRGRPTTPPIGSYRTENGLIIPIYADRNQMRIPDYHRLDLAYTIGRGYNRKKRFKTSWTISLYNVYARRNAFSVFFTQTPFEPAKANQLSVLGTIFPALTFNFETI